MKLRSTYFILILISTLLYSCSTQKDKFLNRSFHRTTAKFNGYFNSKESLKEGLAKLEKSYQEDYTSLLPISILGDQKDAQKIFPQLNRVIDKAALVIEYHSMEVKGKEKNKWIDDCYFMMGKALFFKQEYSRAIEVFSFINREYEGLIRDQAMLWSTRTQIQLGNFSTAEKQLMYLESEARLKKNDLALLAEINADYQIKKERWEDALPYLEDIIKLSKEKNKKARVHFIIAQVYLKLEEYDTAYDYFNLVVKMNPEYEFLFNALLSRARAFNPKYNDSSKLINEITKMLKDDKNIDYKDQIYYALSEIALKEGQKILGIEHLLSATENNRGNDQQQSVAHLTLADIYFGDANYLSAQVHLDTAMTFLNQNHPDYDDLSKKRASLNDLVELYNTISMQDSLVQLTELSEEDLTALIDEIIEAKKEEERIANEALQANARPQTNSNSRNQFNPMSGGGAWYFYNPSAISYGFSEFITKWGERRLEEDWRRKNKRQVFLDQEGGVDEEDRDIYSQEYYLDLIPFSDSAKSATIYIIVQSYYQLGLIYKEDLKDYMESINTFESLLDLYPKNKYEALSYYQLYACHKLLEEPLSAEKYIQKLMAEYPESEYLKMILDPEYYYSENKESVDSAMIYYEEIFTAFKSQNHQDVLNTHKKLREKYKDHPIADQLDLIRSLSSGYLFGEDSLKFALNELVSTYYSGEVVDEAKEILAGLENRNAIPEETLYTYEQKEEHYYILVFETGGPKVNTLKVAMSNFNSKYYSINQYKTQSLMLDLDYQMIIVKTFDKSSSAKKYYQAVNNSLDIKKELGLSEYEHFIISSSNFKTLYKEKSLTEYILYFEAKYLK